MNPFNLAPSRAARALAPEALTPLETLALSEPVAAQWLDANGTTHSFGASLMAALRKWGALTPNQVAAVRKIVASAASAVTVDVSRMRAAFDRAVLGGLQRPKLRLSGFTFALANKNGEAERAIYVRTEAGRYLGIIRGEAFEPSGTCEPEQAAEIRTACEDPEGAAGKYGRLSGVCALCGRPLTDPESVALGIGPVCKNRFFG